MHELSWREVVSASAREGCALERNIPLTATGVQTISRALALGPNPMQAVRAILHAGVQTGPFLACGLGDADKDVDDLMFAVSRQVPARIFEHTGFGGRSQDLYPGRYDMSDLTIGNDVVSSIQVPAGMLVTLYEHEHFGGTKLEAAQALTSLGTFNDKTSSIRVEWK